MSKNHIQPPKSITSPQTGDLVFFHSTFRLGLIYAIMTSLNGVTDSFKIIPVHIDNPSDKKSNDTNNFILPNSLKKELKFPQANIYRVEFKIVNLPVTPNETIEIIARKYTTTFGPSMLKRMDNIIKDERESALFDPSIETSVFVFHTQPPSHVRKAQRPTSAEKPDITIEDANKVGLINDTLLQVLKNGTYGRKKNITMLREAYKLINSANPTSANKIGSILKTGFLASTVSLNKAFDDGFINEDAAFKALSKIGFSQLGLTLKFFGACQAEASEDSHLSKQQFNEYDVNHFLINPFLAADNQISSAWKKFINDAAQNPDVFTKANIKYMYPS